MIWTSSGDNSPYVKSDIPYSTLCYSTQLAHIMFLYMHNKYFFGCEVLCLSQVHLTILFPGQA